MSVNSAVFSPPNPAPLLVAGREILLCSASAVSLDLTTSREPGAWGNYAFDRGTVYVTALRAVFVPDDKAGGVESVVLPLDNVRNLKLEQPLFGANSITLLVVPVPGCGLPPSPSASVKLTFHSSGSSAVNTTILRSTGGTAGLDLAQHPVLNPAANLQIFAPFKGAAMQQPQQPGYYLDAQTLPAYQPFAVPTSIPSYPNGPAMDSKSGPVPPPPPPSQEEGLPSYGSLARQTDDSTSQNPDGVSDDQTARDGEPRRP